MSATPADRTVPAGDPGRPWPAAAVLDRALCGVAALVVAFSLIQIATFGYGRDQGIYAVVARTMLEGGMPYRDAWDFKPPGIFLVYALARALVPEGQWAVRALEVASLAGMALGMMRLARLWWGSWRIGLVAGALGVLVHAQLDFWHTAQPESFGGMLTIAGLALVAASGPQGPLLPSRGRLLRYALCGLLFGCAGLLKPPLAGGGAVVAMGAAWQAWRAGVGAGSAGRRAAHALGAPVALLAGGALAFAACLAWFAARGALGALYQALFVFTPGYTALGWQDATLLGLLYDAFTRWLLNYSSLLPVGLFALLGAGPCLWRRPAVGLLAGVIAVHLLGVALQGKFFPYHFGATWPLTALLAALGYWWLWEHARRRGALGLVLFAAAVLLAARLRTATKDLSDSFWQRSWERVRLVAGRRTEPDLDALASVADVDAAANRAVAGWLARHVPRGEPVYVWGFEPAIYDLGRLGLGSRYIYNVPQRVGWAAGEARAALLADLGHSRPRAIVVAHRDVFPMVTGNLLDSAGALGDFPALASFIEQGYAWQASIEDFDIYLARP
ncbi:MAG: hypothetical protein HY744_22815 [Deltaproteobacteria bacterium]|nr:hypothetical protein [Deltaproteobacteria bacterium]